MLQTHQSFDASAMTLRPVCFIVSELGDHGGTQRMRTIPFTSFGTTKEFEKVFLEHEIAV